MTSKVAQHVGVSKGHTARSAAALKRLRFGCKRREGQTVGLVRRHGIHMKFECNPKAGLVNRGGRKMVHATGETRFVPTRKGVSETAGDRDRALGIGRIDEHVNVDHRAQLWAGIDAVRQGRALEKNDRNADGGENRQQLIDAFFAGDGGAAMAAREGDKGPPDVVRHGFGSFPGKSRNHRLSQRGDTVVLSLVGQFAPELGVVDPLTSQQGLLGCFARDAAIVRAAVDQ